jgi:hypothetical protein
MSYTPSRILAVNNVVSTRAEQLALALKVFAGEVITSFDVTNKLLPLTMTRTITSGLSAQFPNIHQFSAAYHTPGNEITGSVANHSETVITIDDLLIANTFIANYDEAMSHFDVRSTYSKELGGALARQMDRHIAQMLVLAARGSATVTGRSGGTVILNNNAALAGTDLANNGAHIASALFLAAAELDNKNVPDEDRYALFRPAQYYALVRSTDVINRDWGGKGAYSEGEVLKVAGINIIKTNNLPSTDLSAVTDVRAGTSNKYRGNFATTTGLVFHKSAVGTVKLMDLSMETDYQVERQGTLMVAKYAVGHGILRPESAVEIRNAAT